MQAEIIVKHCAKPNAANAFNVIWHLFMHFH